MSNPTLMTQKGRHSGTLIIINATLCVSRKKLSASIMPSTAGMQMEESAKETVIILHGTWAGFVPGMTKWWQPVNSYPAPEGFIGEPDTAPHARGQKPVDGNPAPQEFIGKLDAALDKRGSPARCWAHCSESNPFFHWTPASNSWVTRTRAAAILGNYVASLQKEGWRCHIIAHSHGGNVVVEALPLIAAASKATGLPVNIVTLGTPFIDTRSPILKGQAVAASRLRVGTIGLFVFLMLLVVFILMLGFSLLGSPPPPRSSIVRLRPALLCLALCVC